MRYFILISLMVLQSTALAEAPFGYLLFCLGNDSVDCSVVGGSQGTREALAQVKRQIDARFNVKNDRTESWDLLGHSRTRGDCEDFALTYRNALLKMGWPSSALRLAVGYIPSGEAHAILLAETNQGRFYVLDTLQPSLVPLEAYRFRFDSIQSQHSPFDWP